MRETKSSAQLQCLVKERIKDFQQKSSLVLDKFLSRKTKINLRKDNKQFMKTCKNFFPEKAMTQSQAFRGDQLSSHDMKENVNSHLIFSQLP